MTGQEGPHWRGRRDVGGNTRVTTPRLATTSGIMDAKQKSDWKMFDLRPHLLFSAAVRSTCPRCPRLCFCCCSRSFSYPLRSGYRVHRIIIRPLHCQPAFLAPPCFSGKLWVKAKALQLSRHSLGWTAAANTYNV